MAGSDDESDNSRRGEALASAAQPSRRTFLKRAAFLPLLFARPARAERPARRSRARSKKLHVVVVGAGAFGGWTALELLRRGARVTLIDAWGAGNSRASSGGDTRVIRGAYAGDPDYTAWVGRSLAVFREAEARWRTRLYVRTGALWLYSKDDRHATSSVEPMRAAGLELQRWRPADAARRYPQLRFDDIRSVWFEPEAGYLAARASCERVRRAVVEEGGEFRLAAVRPGRLAGGEMQGVELAGGARISADAYVFACGPWLGRLFPVEVGDRIAPTRQEVYFLGTPAGDQRYDEARLPIWVAFGERVLYGMPGNERRGYKVGDDTRGVRFDPTNGDRTPTPALLAQVRAALRTRLPGLADAPLVEARVCQYEDTPDKHLLIDRHPQAKNAWLVGGGSGHGFKLGPALGEHVAELVLGKQPPKPRFGLARPGLAGATKRDSF